MEKIPNVAWCIPVNRDIYPRIYQNHMGALSYTLQKGIAKIEHFIMPVGKVIDKARNITALKAVKAGVDYLFWVDQDVKIWPHAIERLLLHNKPIVGGLYFIKGPPYYPCMFTQHDEITDIWRYHNMKSYKPGLNSVALIGFGCLLIKVSVFRDMPYPWFRLIKANVTEDVYFCKQALLHDYKIWIDTDIKCKHLGERVEVGEQDFIDFNSQKETYDEKKPYS